MDTPRAKPDASPRPEARPETTALPDKPVELPADIAKTFPAASSLRRVGTPFPHLVAADRSGSPVGYVVDSDSALTTAMGYGGAVPLRLFLDAQARLRRIYILDNCETPAYLEIAVSFGTLDSTLKYDPTQPRGIDAVSLATKTSRAIIAGATATADRVAAEIVGRTGAGSGSR